MKDYSFQIINYNFQVRFISNTYLKDSSPIINKILEILVFNKGEIFDTRLLSLLKSERRGIDFLVLDQALMKMEVRGLVFVSRPAKGKRVVNYNQDNELIDGRFNLLEYY